MEKKCKGCPHYSDCAFMEAVIDHADEMGLQVGFVEIKGGKE